MPNVGDALAHSILWKRTLKAEKESQAAVKEVVRLRAELEKAQERYRKASVEVKLCIEGWEERAANMVKAGIPMVTLAPNAKASPKRNGKAVARPGTFTDQVLSLFTKFPELRAEDVVNHLKMKPGTKSRVKAKKTLIKLYESKRIERISEGLYGGK